MRFQRVLRWLVPPIAVLAIVAAGADFVWPGGGAAYPLTTFRGEQVLINGTGLYRYDTVSSVAQMHGNDIVTLVVGVPLLIASWALATRGSLRGHLLLTGTLGFFTYTYLSMCVGAAYNEFFLVYVALWSLSLWAFVLSLMAFDVRTLPQQFSDRLPRRSIAGLLFGAGGFLLLAWLGRSVPALLAGTTPPLENTTSLFIQALDLGLIVPLAFVGGVLLLRRSAWGYLLAPVMIMKMITMGLAVSVMGINMARVGVAVSAVELIVFPGLTVINLVLAGILFKSIDRPASGPLRTSLPV
jgi:hypothetical protein